MLRPDFTPSIARCAAKYFMEEKVPLRFSYNGNTFTNTSNLQGKLKEVTQMGAELIGDPSVEADAEVISMVIEALKSTGLTRFQVTIGEVDYFRGLCEEAGLDEDTEKNSVPASPARIFSLRRNSGTEADSGTLSQHIIKACRYV